MALFRGFALAAVAALSTIPACAEDPVAALIRRIDQGSAQLVFDRNYGYLPSLLKALDIPVESQMAVFSKTSIQSMRIEPANPRVLYFNDSTTVGWVRGGFVELAALDPGQGFRFYTIQQRLAERLERREDCLRCHKSGALLLRSVSAAPNGVPSDQADVDDRTPFSRLWGGWFVTGRPAPAGHQGNAVYTKTERRAISPALDPKFSLTDSSDVAALMVFAHQVRVMNLLARPGNADEVANAMVFAGEAPLPGAIGDNSAFTETFSKTGPRDSKGRSLRELGSGERLMRYPCSYMIYTQGFDALPAGFKAAVYQRVWQYLKYRATPADREAVVEILRETKNDLPDYFQPAK